MIYCRGRTSGRKGFVSTRNINLSRNTYLSNQCKPVRKEEMGGGGGLTGEVGKNYGNWRIDYARRGITRPVT